MVMDNLLREFNLFAAELNLPSPEIEEVKSFLIDLEDALMEHSHKMSHKALFACCIYVVIQDKCSIESAKVEDLIVPSVTVSDLLEKAEMSITDFFAVTCFLKTNHHLSNTSKQNLIALERKYLIVSALYDKFESMTTEIFCADYNASGPSTVTSSNFELTELLKQHKALCWMLFIVAKAKILWHLQELLATFHLLLCCIAEVVKATPTFLLLPPFDSIVAKSEDPNAVLRALSTHVKTKFEEVIAVHDGWLHVANELIVDSKLPQLETLVSIYSHLYKQSGDIDESQFLNHDWHLLPKNSDTGSPRKQHFTLVRRTLDTSEALNKILLSTSDDFSESLKKSLQKCSVDGSEIIKAFLSESEKTFVKAFVDAQVGSNSDLAERRFKLAVRYYYIMLETFLKKESDRVAPPEFTSFIQNKLFHKSLLACCLEVILMSCGVVSSVNFTPLTVGGSTQAQGIAFPWILKVFDLEPFQFFKIIESFIRAAPTITGQIIKHLKDIEDQILESLAWWSNSSIFKGLSGFGCSQFCKAKSESPKSSYWSPSKESQGTPSTPHICHAVNLFLNKVSRLAHLRLERLCLLLHIPKDVQNNIWLSLEHVIYKKTHLLKDRHLDQLVMCCIFAVCKALEKDVTFKNIVACYDQLPKTSVSVYKYVLSESRKEFITIFYNKEFCRDMKDFVLDHFGDRNKVSPPSSLNSLQSPFTLSPSYSLPGRKNIFISPLRQSPFKNPNEVINRLCPSYSVGSLTQSPKTLQTINDTLNVFNPSFKKGNEVRGKKRLQFNEDDSGDSKAFSSAKKVLRFDQTGCGKMSFVENSRSENPDINSA